MRKPISRRAGIMGAAATAALAAARLQPVTVSTLLT
jgi:hypothetical protein